MALKLHRHKSLKVHCRQRKPNDPVPFSKRDVCQHTVMWRDALFSNKDIPPPPSPLSHFSMLSSSFLYLLPFRHVYWVWQAPDIVAGTEKASSLSIGTARLTNGGAIAEPPKWWHSVLVVPLRHKLRGEAGILGLNLTGPRCPGRLAKSRCLVVTGRAFPDGIN